MIKYSHSATCLCLILVLTCAAVPIPARGDDRAEARLIRFDATATFGPIGKIAWNSLGGSSVEINGRRVRDEQVIWNGDLIEAIGNANVRVLLDSLGQIALKGDAQVRLGSRISKRDDNLPRPVLIASLISGDLAINLQQDAVAYIEARGSVFSTTAGARFRIQIREGRPVIEMVLGDVSIEQQTRPRIKPRDVLGKGSGLLVREVATVGGVSTLPLKKKTNESERENKIRWMKSFETGGGGRFAFVAFHGNASRTQAAPDEPVRFRPVKFEVVPPTLATIQSSNQTNGEGIVTYTFIAGGNPGTGQIMATIEQDPAKDGPDAIYETYHRNFTIEKLGFWRLRTKILVAIAAVGVGCAIGCHPHNGPLKQQPPPTIP